MKALSVIQKEIERLEKEVINYEKVVEKLDEEDDTSWSISGHPIQSAMLEHDKCVAKLSSFKQCKSLIIQDHAELLKKIDVFLKAWSLDYTGEGERAYSDFLKIKELIGETS